MREDPNPAVKASPQMRLMFLNQSMQDEPARRKPNAYTNSPTYAACDDGRGERPQGNLDPEQKIKKTSRHSEAHDEDDDEQPGPKRETMPAACRTLYKYTSPNTATSPTPLKTSSTTPAHPEHTQSPPQPPSPRAQPGVRQAPHHQHQEM